MNPPLRSPISMERGSFVSAAKVFGKKNLRIRKDGVWGEWGYLLRRWWVLVAELANVSTGRGKMGFSKGSCIDGMFQPSLLRLGCFGGLSMCCDN